MYLSSEREPVGREFLSKTAWWKAKEIQYLREDEREMREETSQDDSRKESGNRQDEASTKKGVTKSHPLKISRIENFYKKSLLFNVGML